ncbi:hypothetical protein N431DRAFT_378279 [Stipitochalara longipes BDJ]|nr:hypothetical protein N431DRAFT_378279 [Stipitochalara longipes BDJ]
MTSPRAIYASGGMTCPYDNSVRTYFGDTEARIYAWPSRGGVIILNRADAMDFEFLGLNPLDPPFKRLEDQQAEDAFSQRLLLLGAKWWDSEARYSIIVAIEEGAIRAGSGSFVVKNQPPATMREKRFVKVGWPSTGGLWVAEFDTVFAGVDEEDNLLPEAPSRLQMARTMDERCDMLRDHFEATFYKTLEDYKGYAFLKCWEEKASGEVGPLLKPDETVALWKQGYIRPPNK